MTTTTSDPAASTPKSASRKPHWRSALLGAGAALLFVLASRFVLSDASFTSSITQESCQGQVCVERIQSPDLLLVPGSRQLRVVIRDAEGQDQGRFLAVEDPFSEYSDVKFSWTNGGVTVADGSVVLTWDGAAVDSLRTD